MTQMMNGGARRDRRGRCGSAPFELDDARSSRAMDNVYRFEQATGKVVWQAAYAGGAYEFRLTPQRPGAVFVGAEERETITGADNTPREHVQTSYQGFKIEDGTPLWSRSVRFGKPMNRLIIPLERGLIVSEGDSDKGRIQLLAYDSGEGLWGSRGKGIEFAGRALDYAFAGTDLVLTSGYDSIWTNKDTEYLLHVLDPSLGAMRFPKPFTVKGRMLS
jgi:outer membrane protein assembly factor BamB